MSCVLILSNIVNIVIFRIVYAIMCMRVYILLHFWMCVHEGFVFGSKLVFFSCKNIHDDGRMHQYTLVRTRRWQVLSYTQIETRTLEEIAEVLNYASLTKTSLSRIMLDNMVVPLADGDVDVTMLEAAVRLIAGRFDTEVDSLSTSFAVASHVQEHGVALSSIPL